MIRETQNRKTKKIQAKQIIKETTIDMQHFRLYIGVAVN